VAEAEQPAALEALADEMRSGLNVSDGPLLRVALAERGDGKPSRLLLAVHHLAIDAVSWRILLQDFLGAYGQLLLGGPIQLPPKTTSFRQYALRLEEYARSAALREEAPFWIAEGERFRPAPLPPDRPGGENTRQSAEGVWASLDTAETTELLRRSTGPGRAGVREILLTALARVVGRWTGGPGLLIDLEGHGRDGLEDVDLTRTVGWLAVVYPAWLEAASGEPAAVALRAVCEQLHRIPKHGVGYGVLRYLGDAETVGRLRAAPQAEVCFNYVGQLDATSPAAADVALAYLSASHVHRLGGRRRYALDFSAHVAEGRLHVGFTYSTNLHHRESIERVSADTLAEVRSLLASSPEGVTTR
jgi:non-ribosomal peptide synthase protein (TIGR01720 family)